jgi:predicted  nucleic acid-binding Zn-ribbon protein
MKKVLAMSACIILLTACAENSAEYKKMKADNDSLKLQIKKSEVEMNDMLGILNTIEEDIQSIRETEKYLDIGNETELSGSKREQIKNNMTLIVETLKKNKQKLAELQQKLNASNIQSSVLQKTIDRLTKDLNEKAEFIVQLQNDLNRKEQQITELSGKVNELNINVEELRELSQNQSKQISDQDQSLNTVYYCFGTKKELKEQQILTGGGLFSSTKALQGTFNKEYFISIDKRQVTAIPLYASKARIKTQHPEDSFHFFRDPEGNLTLEIDHPGKFWNLSKYLVIEVK